MDNAQKAIMIGVGLFITIIIISAVLLVVNLGTGLMNDATSELGSISGVLRSQILDNYDGRTKTGSEMLAAVRQYAESDSVAMIITHPGSGNAASTVYNVGAGVITLPTDVTSASYKAGGITGGSIATGTTFNYSQMADKIPSQKYYQTAVVYDAEGNVIGIAAIQK